MYLHVDETDVVWFQQDANKPSESSGLKVGAFAESMRRKSYPAFHLFGLATNANLICRLKHDGHKVMVGTPAVCASQRDRRTSKLALQRIFYVSGPASMGGWHEVNQHDMHTYSLIQVIQWNRKRKTSCASRGLQRLLRRHPAWAALSFPHSGGLQHRLKLIELIVDPRWYVDPQRPNAMSRINSYLGLTPDNVSFITGHKYKNSKPTQYLDRAIAVLGAWGAPDHHRVTSSRDELNPRNFLWRMYSEGSGLFRCLRAAKIYVAFVRQVWLDAITKTGDGLFYPPSIFKRTDEFDAFASYRERNKYLS